MLNASEKSVLKQSFANDIYPTQGTIRNLSKALGLSTRKVYKWFLHERKKGDKSDLSICKRRKLMVSGILQFALVKLCQRTTH